MALTSNVTYSGLTAQNSQRMKDIQRAENAASSYYNLLGGDTKRTNHWDVDDNGNVSHYAHVRREDKLSEKLREKAKELMGKTRKKARIEEKKKCNAVLKNGVSYEKTISDSVSAGIEFIQGMEKQLPGTKFFVGTVSYGRYFGNSSDINFVVNPKFLDKLGKDEAARKQFEEDIKFLNDFSGRFSKQ